MVDGRSVNIMLEKSSFVLDRRSIGKVTLSLDLCPDFIGIVRGGTPHFYFTFLINFCLI